MNEIVLTGLDGSNSIGFLAGLGVLNVLGDRHVTATLTWRPGDWRSIARAEGLVSDDDLLTVLASDLDTWKDDPCLSLKYDKPKGGLGWDLKPPPADFRSYLERLVQRSVPAQRRAVDFAVAFATETAHDNNGNTKPTALHFTAGQNQFLKMVVQLRDGVMKNDLREALFGDWRGKRPLPVLGWDSSATRDYALRANDPSEEKKQGVAGAEWLAFRGLSFIRVMARGGRVVTTGCTGRGKSEKFRWPLWEVPLSKQTVQVLLQMPGLDEMSEIERHARGICVVFSSAIRRSDHGRGSFAPATVL